MYPNRSTHPPLQVLVGGVLLAAAGLAHASAFFSVNTTADLVDVNVSDGQCVSAANTCSLRAAIMQANHVSTAGVTTIIVPAGVYVLGPPVGDDGEASGDLNIVPLPGVAQNLQILGAGPDRTIVDGNQTDRVLHFDTHDNSVGGREARIDGLTIRNGKRNDVGSSAGGLLNYGRLTIANCIIENNVSPSFGGGIAGEGDLTLIDTTVRNNRAVLGGGIYINAFGGHLTIRSSTINGNNAVAGGGIHVNGISGGNIPTTAYIVNSTISTNAANNDGGGIYAGGMSVTALYNVSVINNDADHDRDQTGGIGGGVFKEVGTDSRFIVVNSLIANNTVLDAPIFDDCNGTLEVYGWNLFGTTSGCSYAGNGTAARGLVALNSIGPLQDNGGTTPTHALLAGSAAIDSTFPSPGCIDETGAFLGYDQRGAPRPAGLRCDVGAYEYGAIPPVSDRIFKSGFEVTP